MRRRVLNFMAAWLGPLALRAWFSSVRIRWYGGKYLHPHPGTRNEAIYVMWHVRLLYFAYTHAEFQGRILVSPTGWAGWGTLLTQLTYFAALLRTFEMPEVATPTWRATSAKGRPRPVTSSTAICARTLDTRLR